MRSLLLVGDDFGLCRPINEGICLAHRAGLITHTSLIVNPDYFDESVYLLRQHPDLKVGVHLNLTDGRPVLPLHDVRSLVNRKGEFLGGRHYRVALSIVMGVFKVSEIKAEWRAQILKAKEAGLEIKHLNSHGNLHFLPKLHQVVLDLIKEFRIPFLRLLFSSGSFKGRMFKTWSEGLLRKIVKDQIQVHYPTRTFGFASQGHLSREKILKALGQVKLIDGTVEFILHPASETNPYHRSWGYNSVDELRHLLDPEVRSLVEQGGLGPDPMLQVSVAEKDSSVGVDQDG